MPVSQDQLEAIMPDSKTDGRAAAWAAPLNAALDRFEINTTPRIAMFIGNMAVESGQLSAREEDLRYSANRLRAIFPGMFAGAKSVIADQIVAAGHPAIANYIYDDANRPPTARLGNTQPGDGFRYRGRGPLQTTGRSNYAAFFASVGMPKDSDPDFLLTPDGGSTASAFFWKSHGCNPLADAGDFSGCVSKINPAQVDMAKRQAFFAKAMAVL